MPAQIPGPLPIPVGETAMRLDWRFLPPHIRSAVEGNCGSPVVGAESRDAGFTPGFASVLTCADGSRHFVKAAAATAQREVAAMYREEARKLAALPAAAPAPRLQWTIDADWLVLGLEYVDAANPVRPWQPDQLDACLDALEAMVEPLTPPPAGLSLDSFWTEHRQLPGFWDHLRATRPDLVHADQAAELAAGFAEASGGHTLVHTDVRDDNLLVGDGRVWLCDWNWPTVGAPWLDSLLLLIGPRGDGLDVESIIASRRLLADVPPDHVDAVLALLVGYFLRMSDEPVPTTSPHLRDFQRWQGEVCWDWLCERRGWR